LQKFGAAESQTRYSVYGSITQSINTSRLACPIIILIVHGHNLIFETDWHK